MTTPDPEFPVPVADVSRCAVRPHSSPEWVAGVVLRVGAWPRPNPASSGCAVRSEVTRGSPVAAAAYAGRWATNRSHKRSLPRRCASLQQVLRAALR